MPIRKENRGRYPSNWGAIRQAVLDRAGNRCEGSPAYPHCRAENGKPHPVTGSIVVLTTAHLEDPIENCDLSNLKIWCQRCHLTYDAQRHARNARLTRMPKEHPELPEIMESEGMSDTKLICDHCKREIPDGESATLSIYRQGKLLGRYCGEKACQEAGYEKLFRDEEKER